MSNIPDDIEMSKMAFEAHKNQMKHITTLEKELIETYQLVDKLRQERQILMDMMKDVRKAFYVDGTNKAMREVMNKLNNPFKILVGEFLV